MIRTHLAQEPAPTSRACPARMPASWTMRWRHHLLAALLLSACVLLAPPGARAQVNPEIASCSELKDEATVTQADLCAAHVGCRFALRIQKTCARAKGYIERLQAAIGEGTRTFLGGYRKEVTPDAVFTAVLTGDDWERQNRLAGVAQARQQAEALAKRVRETGSGDTLSGTTPKGEPWVYYGQSKGEEPHGIGSLFFANGEIHRGEFRDGDLQGPADVLFSGGSRFVGSITDGTRTGLLIEAKGNAQAGTRLADGTFTGTYTFTDGRRFEGTMKRGSLVNGKQYRADGSLAEEGSYQNEKLSVGTQYDAAGVRTAVNLPAEREAAARETAEKARLAAQAEQERKREQALQAEQQFRASLQALNPGQLFARADELDAQGDKARAREVRRTLMSRFPDHPLAATAAQQMAGAAGGGTASTAPGRSTGGRASSQSCDAMKQAVIATKVPPGASITASQETVMFMTKTVLDMIDANCPTEPGVTPAQIEAERKLRQQQYAAAESACNAVQSGGRRCVPQVHAAAGTPSTKSSNAPAVSSAPRTPTISYDPVTGRCIGDREACACEPGIGDNKEYGACPRARGSSGGGIRTAR